MGQIQQILDERYTMLTKHAAVAGLIACAGFVQISAANDSETERAAALERLEQARLAFEAAKAELEAAQRDAAAVTSGSIQSEGETESESYLQPEGEADMPEDPNSWADGWDFKAFVGINGASGNSESLSARASIDGERFTSKYETKVGASYVYGTSDGDKDTSRGEAFINNDWLLDESRWRVFATGKYEYDEFQAWDHRLSASLGLGYELYEDEDTTLLLGRVGIGAYYEIGDMADEELVPEGVLGPVAGGAGDVLIPAQDLVEEQHPAQLHLGGGRLAGLVVVGVRHGLRERRLRARDPESAPRGDGGDADEHQGEPGPHYSMPSRFGSIRNSGMWAL